MSSNGLNFELCGKWFFSMPGMFGLSVCCSGHDHAYTVLRAECLETMLQISEFEDPAWVPLQADYYLKIEEANQRFYSCMNEYLAGVGPVRRQALKPFARAFKRIVRRWGYKIWAEVTLARWAELEKLRAEGKCFLGSI